jgi:DNA-binding protein Fis
MARTEGNISAAARDSGLTRYHLREMLKKHELVDKFRR